MTDRDIENLLRDALAAEPSAKADAAVREAISRAAAANAAKRAKRAERRRAGVFAGFLRRAAPPLLAASFAVAAILHFNHAPRDAASRTEPAATAARTEAASTNTAVKSSSDPDFAASTDETTAFDEGDFLLEITSMSDSCLIFADSGS